MLCLTNFFDVRVLDLVSMPMTLDPEAFAKARTAEVMLLKKEIADGEFRGTRRVFQTLPRSMRRRAASHNIRRLPVRLREKALAEVYFYLRWPRDALFSPIGSQGPKCGAKDAQKATLSSTEASSLQHWRRIRSSAARQALA